MKLNKYIQEEKLLNDFYYVNEKNYDGNILDDEHFEIHNTKQIKETNIETDEIIIYKSMQEVYDKRGICRATLRNCIKDNRICNKKKNDF